MGYIRAHLENVRATFLKFIKVLVGNHPLICSRDLANKRLAQLN